MKDLIRLFRRFLPPYKGRVVLNFVFNLLAAVFTAFSFGLLSPILGILFGTDQPVRQLVPWEMTIDSLKNNVSYFLTWVIDTYGQSTALIYIGLFLITMVIFKVLFMYLASLMMMDIRNSVVRDIRILIYDKLIALPLGFFSDERKGDIMARMTTDVQEIENSVMNSLDMLFKNPILILTSLVYMIYTSWSLTIFVFIMLPFAGLLIGRVGKSLKKQSRKGTNKQGEILSIIEEDMSGLRVIKAFTAEKQARGRFSRENENYRLIMNKLMSRYYLAHPMSEFLGTAVIVIVLWYGGNLIISEGANALSPQQFIVYLVFFYNIINPAKAFSTALYSVEKGLASMERIDRILSAENNIVDKPSAVAKASFNSSIEYRDVSFRYVKDKVLDQVRLTIAKGQTVAFVGKSGSGKTTLVDLLPRFWDVSEGAILIDGVDIRDMKLHDLRCLMGNVNQEPILFNDTFFNNIAFGVDGASEEDVVNAAKIANAHEFIVSAENGYQTNIGDRGDKLSGGQKQRISIARAILKNPPILILDEATSALDTESEKLVQQALENLMKNRTSLVIAHRLSTIKNADLICVMHEGKIVEMGPHDELLAKKGQYYRLHRMQNF
ncbi:ABC transporter ATP-binding protein [Mangrovibacterium marinum]|uniref:ATP-binding cassette, subfamily B, MsbA n=1 Tax=Mangrovibacterium marinum TaxID=1639118 RepID=A0A2T5C4S4_9BACT|nr:ABC transporter ATP-binding protein [Mangrovibacterium marinum]PTN09856.1 ATP-binding cassette, subfamily B, MsbA [Mangrovibacterium marinum]